MLIPIDTCPGAMADHYRDSSDPDAVYGEFNADWGEGCDDTLSEQRSGRSDRATIERWYPELLTPGEGDRNPGPHIQPLAITQVSFAPFAGDERSNVMEVPYFYLANGSEAGSDPAATARGTRIFLFTGDLAGARSDGRRWLIDLGRPEGRLINVRGAKYYTDDTPPDVLCAYRSLRGAFDCAPLTSSGGSDELELAQPIYPLEIHVSPVSSTTVSIAVNVSNTYSEPLTAQIFSPDFPAAMTTTLESASGYSKTVTLTMPSLGGYVAVGAANTRAVRKCSPWRISAWAAIPRSQYVWASAQEQVWGNANAATSGPTHKPFGAGFAYQFLWANSLQYVFSGAMQYVWSGAHQYVWANAPLRSCRPRAVSNDGQVMIYSPS